MNNNKPGHTGASGAEIRSSFQGQPWVFVLSRSGTPLGLAHPAVVRKWRRGGKARMHRVGPAVARLRCVHAEACFVRKHAPECGGGFVVRIGIDPGSKVSALALALGHRVVYTCEIVHRSADITRRCAQRRGARSGRRCRRKKAAGRGPKPARWRHRCRKTGWLPPSVYHRVQSIRRWTRRLVRFARAMATSVTVHVETSAFDIHKVLHPEVAGTAYQRGALYESNLRGYVLTRDRARCVYCGARPGKGGSEAPVVLQLDHVAPRGLGSDAHWNRVTACAACNDAKGRRTPQQWLDEDAPATVKRRARAVLRYVDDVTGGRVSLSAMAAANVVGPCVAEKLSREGLRVVTCSGADTAAWRKATGVAKSHAVDAACAAMRGTPVAYRCAAPVRIEMTGCGRRLVVRRNGAGFPALKKDGTPIAGHRHGAPHGVRAGDVVRVDKPEFGRRRRTAVVTTARYDGRCKIRLRSGKEVNIMASRLAIIHRGCGARVGWAERAPRTRE